jgi:hypothetical protein
VASYIRLLTRAAVAVVVALALLAALEQLPKSVREADRLVDENAHASRLERELAPARAFALDPALAVRARELLPPDAVFYVATGPGLPSGHDAASPFSAYWLLPRRLAADPREADWILSYGADPAELGVPTKVVADLGGGETLLRVLR